MKVFIRTVLLSLLLLICARSWHSARAQSPSSPAIAPHTLTLEQVVNRLVQRNMERAQALAAYHGTRIYRLEYRGFTGSRSAEMVVDVSYRSPRTKEFSIQSETGSRLVIEKVFHKLLQSEKEALNEENQAGIALNRDNYRFALVGYTSMPTGLCYVLSVEPLTKNKLLYRGRIWVDAEDFAVVRIEAAPAKNPSFWTKESRIEQAYTKVGDFWLPLSNRSSSTIRLGGHAELTIQYQDYQITTASALSLPTRFARIPKSLPPWK
jgi:outer membrane lipoprotein-sorting protein